MNKHEFLKKLSKNGISFSSHGSRHDIYVHNPTGKKVVIPRHSEYSNDFLKLILREVNRP
jgi:predicted RNA binding protein YcfA (HicA-like mRNA interferase family)